MEDSECPPPAHFACVIVITIAIREINVLEAIVRPGHIEVGGYGNFFAHIDGYRYFVAPVAIAGISNPEEVGDDGGAAEPHGGGTAVAASGGLGPGGLSRVGDSRGDGCWQS